jgi:hypothetical protein
MPIQEPGRQHPGATEAVPGFRVGGQLGQVVYHQQGDQPSDNDEVIAALGSRLDAYLFAFLIEQASSDRDNAVREWLDSRASDPAITSWQHSKTSTGQ